MAGPIELTGRDGGVRLEKVVAGGGRPVHPLAGSPICRIVTLCGTIEVVARGSSRADAESHPAVISTRSVGGARKPAAFGVELRTFQSHPGGGGESSCLIQVNALMRARFDTS
jgi:hypothetical protein